ncbi:MAG TPA: protein translocase subunit SecF [Ilumatobacteraceae bacterium]|nr:protein translocase subunit SecF [Ilumatobacteraceae bacterium]
MTTVETVGTAMRPVARTRWRRLILAQTAIDFWGKRRVWLLVSTVLLVVTGVSLVTRGLVLGIDFEGGVAWDVPAGQLSVDDARQILSDNGLESDNAKIQERNSDSGDIIKVQVEDQPADVRVALQEAFAEAAGVQPADVSVASVSATWGKEITRKAVTALIVFLLIIAVYISFRFEWRMALTALLAMVHDVLVSIGIYSVFGFEVTPATVVAFLTVLGYSLYDSIVVFDRIRDNERRVASSGLTAGDLVNISTNQVLLRSINTTMASALPVISLLLIGAGLFGQVTLREFAIALLVGMLTGAYSSIFVASPLLGWLKTRSPAFAGRGSGPGDHLTGEDLRAVVIAGPGGVRSVSGRRRRSATTAPAAGDDAVASTAPEPAHVVAAPADRLLTHPPRPRKKKRR